MNNQYERTATHSTIRANHPGSPTVARLDTILAARPRFRPQLKPPCRSPDIPVLRSGPCDAASASGRGVLAVPGWPRGNLGNLWERRSFVPDGGCVLMRLRIAACLVAVMMSSCGSLDALPAAGTVPEVTTETAAELSAHAVVRACELHCGGLTIYVHDRVFGIAAHAGTEKPMQEPTRVAISDRLNGVEFLDTDETDALFEGGVLADATAVVVYVGPIEELGAGILAVDIGVATARDGFRYETHQFRWTGSSWELATAAETGVTVTTSVS